MKKHNFLVSLFLISLAVTHAQGVSWFWCGALTPQSVVVVTRTATPAKVRLALSGKGDFSDTRFFGPFNSEGLPIKFLVDGLLPGAKYFYRFEVNGQHDPREGQTGHVRTPLLGPQHFSFAFGSCAGDSDCHGYRAMAKKDFLFYLNVGDLHYGDPKDPLPGGHRDAYESRVLSKIPALSVFRKAPFAYIWDDHDSAGNDSDGLSVGMPGARVAFSEYIPHYPTPLLNTPDFARGPICQAFTIGRVRFVMIDARSERSNGRVLQAPQLAWFQSEIQRARDARQLIAFVTSYSWGGDRKDNWGGFTNQRREMADFLRESAVTNLMILSGDAHMVAVDDGSHHDFAGVPSPYRYPVFQSSAIANRGSVKGGTYSIFPPVPNPPQRITTNGGRVIRENWGQYALVHVKDEGGPEIAVTFEAFQVDLEGNEKPLLTWTFNRRL